MTDTSDAIKRLAEVRQAIQTVLVGGQSYKIGNTSLTRADLYNLRRMQQELEQEIAEAEADGGIGRCTAAVCFDKR
ncbi:MAG: peptidylprolyl isomerase [bacterium]|nr:peptidylprolyl isomerase [bacterium]